MITKETVQELFNYKDGQLVWKVSPRYGIEVGSVAGYTRKDGYKLVKIKGKYYLIHRLIFLYHHGYLPNLVDHINVNNADNRIENLREASKKENVYNTDKIWSHNTSGVRGVSWDNKTQKWSVRFRHKGKYLFFGYYEVLEDAASKRQEVERRFLQ